MVQSFNVCAVTVSYAPACRCDEIFV